MAQNRTDRRAQDCTELQENGCYVALTTGHLDAQSIMDRVKSPEAGAIVLFAGTTRDNFAGKPVKELQYSAYNKLALRTMMVIARDVLAKHSLKGVAIIHRLGTVPIGEESILVAVSAPHRQAAWRAGEEALEGCKAHVEVWKREEFEGEEGVWRANRDGLAGQRLSDPGREEPQDIHGGPLRESTFRPGRPGERGHGPVIHPQLPQAQSAKSEASQNQGADAA